MMLKFILPVLVLAVGCATTHSVVTPDHFTTPDPAPTAAEAVAAAPPVVDPVHLAPFPRHDAVQSVQGQPAPFTGVTVSLYDAARYAALVTEAERLRAALAAEQWEHGRMERRDASYIHTLEYRIDEVSALARRRRILGYCLLGAGVIVGGFVTYEAVY